MSAWQEIFMSQLTGLHVSTAWRNQYIEAPKLAARRKIYCKRWPWLMSQGKGQTKHSEDFGVNCLQFCFLNSALIYGICKHRCCLWGFWFFPRQIFMWQTSNIAFLHRYKLMSKWIFFVNLILIIPGGFGDFYTMKRGGGRYVHKT